MILAASLVIHNERARYLPIVLAHLREFCDQITILDDHSSDGTLDWLRGEVDGQLAFAVNEGETFDEHEGHVRQKLLTLTLSRQPTHVLAIDADELIGDGPKLRRVVEASPDVPAWTLEMTEVWSATPEAMQIRMDGAWRQYSRVHLWRVPEQPDGSWQIAERQLACSPIPMGAMRATPSPSAQAIFHFGWADPTTRQARYDRYMRIDGGRFHASAHLRSILQPPRLRDIPWPDASWVEPVQAKLLA